MFERKGEERRERKRERERGRGVAILNCMILRTAATKVLTKHKYDKIMGAITGYHPPLSP